MKIVSFKQEINQVKTRVELLDLLKQYRWMLNKEVVEYLESLIDLERSVILEPYSFEPEKYKIGELDIFKQIAIYNIYQRASKLFNPESFHDYTINNNENGYEGLRVYEKLNDERGFYLFDFNYGEKDSVKIPNGYRTDRIGDIHLYRTLASKENREAEINSILNQLEHLYDETNPYQNRSDEEVFGGPASFWSTIHYDKIKHLEKKLEELDSKKELDKDDMKEIRISNIFRKRLLNDYKLKDEDFVDEGKYLGSRLNRDDNNMNRTRVKRLKHINIIDHTKYI
jgi:hypothetical protein